MQLRVGAGLTDFGVAKMRAAQREADSGPCSALKCAEPKLQMWRQDDPRSITPVRAGPGCCTGAFPTEARAGRRPGPTEVPALRQQSSSTASMPGMPGGAAQPVVRRSWGVVSRRAGLFRWCVDRPCRTSDGRALVLPRFQLRQCGTQAGAGVARRDVDRLRPGGFYRPEIACPRGQRNGPGGRYI